MRSVSASRLVGVSQQRAWELFCDMSRWHEWVEFTDEVVERPDAIREGAAYKERSHIGPFKQTSEWWITELDPPNRQVHIGRVGPLRPKLIVAMEPEGEGTRLTQAVEVSLPLGPLAGIVERLPASMIRKDLIKTIDGFKAFAERNA